MKDKPPKIIICSGQRYNFKKSFEECENKNKCSHYTKDYYKESIHFDKYKSVSFRYKKDFVKCDKWKIK